MTINDFKLLEEKVEKMISFIERLRKERNQIHDKLMKREEEMKHLKKTLEEIKGSGPDVISREDIADLIENLKEERTVIRDSLKGALRLITE